jgi:hypothetical protein
LCVSVRNGEEKIVGIIVFLPLFLF